jgi:putative DNA primase/helicase
MQDYQRAVHIGVVLDDAILLDWDGNKGNPMPLPELAALLGLPEMPQTVQENAAGDSLHFLFKWPTGVDRLSFKHSADGWMPSIDIKTGNQLMHLKPHKFIADGELPRLEELSDAPSVLLDALQPSSPGAASTATGGRYPDWLKDMLNGKTLHGNALRVTGNMVARGLDKDTILATFKAMRPELERARGSERVRALFDTAELVGMIDGAIEKGYAPEVPRSFEEVIQAAQELDQDATPAEIEAIIADSLQLSSIERRQVFNALKQTTGTPIGELRASAAELRNRDGDDPDQLAMARAIIEQIGPDNILSADTGVSGWDPAGVWRQLDDRTTRQMVQVRLPDQADEVSAALVAAVTDLMRTEIHRPFHTFNVGNPETVNCLNGELELTPTGWELVPHRREHYRTTQIPVAFDPTATAPLFLRFIEQIFQGDPDALDKAQAILEMFGYTLMAHCRHERFIILVGGGANGKSVLLAILEALCGIANVAGVQPSQFENKFQRAHLHNKLANIVTEIKQGEMIDDASLKGIVSGEPTTVEHKFRDPFVMRPFSTCWFGTNHMPHTRDFSDALFRRALVVQFNQVFKPELGNCDPLLKDKLLDELPGILNMALSAYQGALERSFTIPASSLAARDEWRLEADQVAQFVEEACRIEPRGEVKASLLYTHYKNWAGDVGIHRTLTMKSFRDRLTKLGLGNRRTNHGRYVTGITYTPDLASRTWRE